MHVFEHHQLHVFFDLCALVAELEVAAVAGSEVLEDGDAQQLMGEGWARLH